MLVTIVEISKPINLAFLSCIFHVYAHCECPSVFSNSLCVQMNSRTDCIYLVFLHCAFFNISSNYLHNGMYNYISPTFPHCVFLNEFSQWLQLIGFTPPCVFKCFIKITWFEISKSHLLHYFNFVSSWVCKCLFKLLALWDVKLHGLFPIVCF